MALFGLYCALLCAHSKLGVAMSDIANARRVKDTHHWLYPSHASPAVAGLVIRRLFQRWWTAYYVLSVGIHGGALIATHDFSSAGPIKVSFGLMPSFD